MSRIPLAARKRKLGTMLKKVPGRRVLVTSAAFIVVFIIAVFFFSSLIIRPFQGLIVRALSARLGAEITVGQAAFDAFPEPTVVLRQVRVSVPGKMSADVPSITFYPDISQIFSGKILSGRYYSDGPRITIVLSSGPQEKKQPKTLSFPENISEQVVNGLSAGGKFFGTCMIANGRADILQLDRGRRLQLQNIQISLGRDPEAVFFACCADAPLWDTFSLTGRVAYPEGSGQISLAIRRCLLQPLAEFFFFQAERTQLAPADAEAVVSFLGKEGIAAKADLFGRVEPVGALKPGSRYPLQLESLHAAGMLKNGNMSITLPEIRFRQPEAVAAASFSLLNKSPRIRCSLASSTFTVAGLSEVAMRLAPDSRLVQNVIKIVKAGNLPFLKIILEAEHASDLLKAEHLRLEGSIAEGRILVPKVNLDLQDVTGTFTIGAGILNGSAQHVRLGAISGENGAFTIDLLAPGHPFDAVVRAHSELIQLLPLIRTWVRNQKVHQVLDMTQDLQGSATGTFTISGGRQGTTVAVMVDRFDLRARLAVFPFPIRIAEGSFSYTGNTAAFQHLVGSWGASSFKDLAVAITRSGDQFALDISCPGTIRLALREVYPWLRDATRISHTADWIPAVNSGALLLEETRFTGPLQKMRQAKFRFLGRAEQIGWYLPALRQSGTLTTAAFDAVPGRITVSNAQVRADSTVLHGSALITGYPTRQRHTEVNFQGIIQQPELNRLVERIKPLQMVQLAGPVSVSRGTLVWGREGALNGAVTLTGPHGTEAEVSVQRESLGRTRYSVAINQEQSQISCVLIRDRERLEVRAVGELTKALLDRLLLKNKILSGWVEGDITALIDLNDLTSTVVQGEIAGRDVILPWREASAAPVILESFALQAVNQEVYLDHAVAAWQQHTLNITGSVHRSGDHFTADLDLITSQLGWDLLQILMPKHEQDKQPPENRKLLPIEGRLTVRAGEFVYNSFTWSPFFAVVSLARDRTVRVDITDAQLCTILTPGHLTVSPAGLEATVNLSASDAHLAPTITCLRGGKKVMSGTFDLTGDLHLTRKSPTENVLRGLEGEVEFRSRKGRIYRMGIMSKILTLLSVTDIVEIKVPELFKNGLAYDTIRLKGYAREGTLVVDDVTMKGPSLSIAGAGTIDLVKKRMKFDLLAAPLRRVDRVLGYIPVVSSVFGAEIITVPVRVSGSLKDPSVRALPVSAVSGNLMRIMKNTLHLPLKLIQPLVK